MKKSTWSLVLVLAMAAWASFYPFTKIIQGTIDPLLLAFFRFFFASIVLLPVVIASKKLTLPLRNEWLPLLVIAAFAVVPTALTAVGIKLSSSIVGSILVNTNPLFAAALAPLLITEHVTLKRARALVLGFVGIVVIILNGQSVQSLFQSTYFTGSLLLIGSSILSALFAIYAKKYIRKYGGLYVTFFTVAPGTLILALLLLFHGGFAQVPSLPPLTWLFAILNGVLATAIPYVVWSSSVKHLDVTTATSFKLLIPVFAALYSLAFLKENFTPWMLAGMILTGIGVYLVQREETTAKALPVQ